MKKLLLFVLFLFFTFGIQINAQFTEGFEGPTFPPAGWTVINNGDFAGWESCENSDIAHSGFKYACIDYLLDIHDDWLITPAITVSDSISDRYRFWAKGDGYIDIEVSTTGTDESDFDYVIASNVQVSSDWEEYKFDLSAYMGQTIYIGINILGEGYLSVDDAVNDGLPDCPEPILLKTGDITKTSAVLDWTEYGSADHWEIKYGPEEYFANTVSLLFTTGKPVTLTDLYPGTKYVYYIRSRCDVNGGTGKSTWTGPKTFVTVPANDDCDNATSLTVVEYGDCPAYAVTTDATSATDKGDNACSLSNMFNYGVWYNFVAPSEGKVIVNYTGGTATGNPSLVLYDACGGNEISGTCHNVFNSPVTIKGLTPGNTYYLLLWFNSFYSKPGSFDICLEKPAPCITPSELSVLYENYTGAILSWKENSVAELWDLYIVPAGSPAPTLNTTPTVHTAENPYTWTNGYSQTRYDWYVRAVCDDGEVSEWSRKNTFTTTSEEVVDWCNLQSPPSDTIIAGNTFDVFARVYKKGVTDYNGQGPGILAWIGYNTKDTLPFYWPASNWSVATYYGDAGNKDEYTCTLGNGLAPGTYYYVSSFKWNKGYKKFGGYSHGGGGFWDGTTNKSGILVVKPVDGDMLCDAIPLTVDAPPGTYSNEYCTSEPNEPKGSCWLGTSGDFESIWFSFVAPNSGSVRVSTDFQTALSDTHIAIYEAGDCNDMTTLTEIACDEDGASIAIGNSIAYVCGLTPGNTYYVQVDGYNSRDGNFKIEVNSISVAPASSTSMISTNSCEDGEWTHYYNGKNILLSLKPGSSGMSINNVSIDAGGSTDVFWVNNDSDGFPTVSGASGAAFMKRKWDVNVFSQPSSEVGVRFYYTQDEFDAINNEIINHGGVALTSHNQLNFYKVLTSSIDPFNIGPGGLSKNDIKLIKHGSSANTDSWIEGTFNGGYYAEFLVSGFSGGSGGGSSSGASLTLLLDLISFSGYAGKNANILTWITGMEKNSDLFIIQRSGDGNEWKDIAKIKAAGESYTPREYTINDENPLPQAFYRLKISDIDGQFKFSKTIFIDRKNRGLRLYSVFPNPSDGNFLVKYSTKPGIQGEIAIINILGKKVYSKKLDKTGSMSYEKINISNLPGGIYSLMLEQGSQRVIKKVFVSK